VGSSADLEAVIALALIAGKTGDPTHTAENNPHYSALDALESSTWTINSIHGHRLRCRHNGCGKPAWGIEAGYKTLVILCWQHYRFKWEAYSDESQFFVIPEDFRPERAPEDQPGGINNPHKSKNRTPRPMRPPRPLEGRELEEARSLEESGAAHSEATAP